MFDCRPGMISSATYCLPQSCCKRCSAGGTCIIWDLALAVWHRERPRPRTLALIPLHLGRAFPLFGWWHGARLSGCSHLRRAAVDKEERLLYPHLHSHIWSRPFVSISPSELARRDIIVLNISQRSSACTYYMYYTGLQVLLIRWPV